MDVHTLISLPAVRRARSRIHKYDAETLREQVEVAQIPAPSLAEGERASYVARRFRTLGLMEVHTDEVGNVLGSLPGHTSSSQLELVLVCAHLDTVFPAGAELTVRRAGRRIHVPGITDNARGITALLTLARVLVECEIHTSRPLRFAATVGEEGIGDLRGVKHLFRPDSPLARAAAFISLDGSGTRRIVHRAVGSRRLRATITGPGGHSWADWGAPNPAHALGTAIADLCGVPLPETPRTTLTVARVGGGSSVNAVPSEAWLELDLRSEGADALARVEDAARSALRQAVESESEGRPSGTAPLGLEIATIGDRPSGEIPPTHALVRAAMDATRAVGSEPELAASSTDANMPIALGVPAITIGAGGGSGGVHTSREWYDNQGGARGIERALLTVLAMAGVD